MKRRERLWYASVTQATASAESLRSRRVVYRSESFGFIAALVGPQSVGRTAFQVEQPEIRDAQLQRKHPLQLDAFLSSCADRVLRLDRRYPASNAPERTRAFPPTGGGAVLAETAHGRGGTTCGGAYRRHYGRAA